MNPKSGKPGSLVAPLVPAEAQPADDAKPGSVSRFEAEPITPHKPDKDKDKDPEKKHWIEIKLVDQDNKPVAGEECKVKLPDGTYDTGSLDNDGFVRIDGIDPGGTCQVTFPKLDGGSWKKV